VENQEAYQKAKKRVEAKNLITSSQYLWFKWPLIGWGIGVFFHALAVFAFTEGSSIKERMIQKEMQKETLKKH